jgi:glutamate synthase (ferredoxin)
MHVGVGFIASVAGTATHELIEQALSALGCLEHRGGCSADQDSGDGAGLMTAIPWELFKPWFTQQEISMPSTDQLGVGMVFLPQDATLVNKAREIVEGVLQREGLTVLGWRVVPVQESVLGTQAREHQPKIEQVLVTSAQKRGDELERSLYTARRRIGKALEIDGALKWSDDFYICSFSKPHDCLQRHGAFDGTRRILYRSKKFRVPKCFAVYHRRFSTNTMPKWPLAQPMRLLGHNGEINTLLGNINWMMAREADLTHPLWGSRTQESEIRTQEAALSMPSDNGAVASRRESASDTELDDLKPIVNPDNSDSATLDNVLELLVHSGRSPVEALMFMVPEAYQNQPDLENYPQIVDFYEYYSGIQEPWDGPALLVFSDGKTCRSHPRSQWTATCPLQHYAGRLRRRRFRSRSCGLARSRDCRKRAIGTRADDCGGLGNP